MGAPTDEDKNAWIAAVEDVKKRPAKQHATLPVTPPIPAVSHTVKQHKKPPLIVEIKSQSIHLQPLICGEFSGIDAATIRRLKRGQLAISARVDLHGMTQTEAYEALIEFLEQALGANKRLVLAITGKGRISQGGGVLKNMLPIWLNQPALRPHILGFDTAHIQHGGSGAFYILLKRKRV